MSITAAELLVKVGTDTSDAESGLKSFSGKMKGIAGGMGAVGGILSAAVAAPLIGIGVTAVKTAGDFERSMNVLAYSSGASADQMQRMSDQALQLGADTVFSANEAAQGMVDLAKAGMKTEDVMGAIPGVMDLAAAGQIGVSEAANLTAAALNTFGLQATEAAHVADVLAAAANASTADVADLAFGMQNAGAVFASNSQSVETLATMMALLANNGINASDAATSLKTMTMRLTAPTAAASKVMKQLGINVFDAEGNMRDYHDIVSDLSSATRGMSDAQKDAAFNTVFGADAIRAATILAQEGTAGYESMAAAVNTQGAASAMAAAQNNGLAGAMEQISGSIESLMTKMALPFLPTISGWLTGITEFINGLGTLSPAVVNATLAFAGFAVALSATLLAGAGIAGVIGALATPVGLVVLAVIALAAAVAGLWLAWDLNWGNIQEKTASVLGAITPMISSLTTALTGMATQLSTLFAGSVKVNKAGDLSIDLKSPAAKIQAMMDDLTKTINNLDLTGIDWFGVLDRMIIKPLTIAFGMMIVGSDKFSKLVTAVTNAITAIAWGDLGGAFVALKDAVVGQLYKVVNDIVADLTPTLLLIGLAFRPVALAIGETFNTIATTIGGAIAKVKAVIDQIAPIFNAWVGAISSLLSLDIIGWINNIASFAASVPSEEIGRVIGTAIGNIILAVIRGFTGNLEQQASNMVTSAGIGAQLTTTIASALAAVDWGAFWSGLGTALMNLFATLQGQFVAFFGGLFSGVSDTVGGGWQQAFAPLIAMVQPLVSTVQSIISAVQQVSAAIGSLTGIDIAGVLLGFVNGFIAMSASLTGFAATVADFSWPEALATFAWGSYVTAMAWGDYISSFVWSTFITVLSWATFISNMSWNSYVPELSWSAWINHLNWGDFISWLSIPSSGGGGGGVKQDPLPGIPAGASGFTNFPGGMALVGEKGPELVNLPRGSDVYSHNDSMAMAAGGITINVNVASINNGMDIEQLAAQLARRFQQKLRL